MIVHLVDGTYELFRHFYGIRRFRKTDPPFGAVTGVLSAVVKMIEDGATHIGVATDHVIESFRNGLWAEYKTGAGIEPVLRAQFQPLEEALLAMGVVVGVLQAATQINEPTIAFVVKAITLAATLALTGHFLLGRLVSFTVDLFQRIPQLTG
jgi:flagellar biosynthesis protein FliQ